MSEVTFSFSDIVAFQKAIQEAAPEHLTKAMGRAFYLIGKSDTERMRTTGLSELNIRSKGFRNSFKFKATDSREATSLSDIKLSEYTGAKPFRIFQEGGDVSPVSARTLMILTDASKTAGGKRKYSQKDIGEMLASGQAKVIETKTGPAVIKVGTFNKGGEMRKNSKLEIIAFLKPRITQKKRIDFYKNYEDNSAEHERILGEAAERAINKTLDEED